MRSREAPITPSSRIISRLHSNTRTMQERDALMHLCNYIFYRPSTEPNGERSIFRGLDHRWSANCVPQPDSSGDTVLRDALEAVGIPPRPTPDVTYGYDQSTFTQSERDSIAALSAKSKVTGTNNEPHFPFLVVEWKSRRGDADKAELQAARCGAAGVYTHWQFLREAGGRTPQPEDTAIFSARVTGDTIDLYVHWRRMDPRDGLSWEMDKIRSAFLDQEEDVYKVRSLLLEILDWARGDRLHQIKAALALRNKPRTLSHVEIPATTSHRYGLLSVPQLAVDCY